MLQIPTRQEESTTIVPSLKTIALDVRGMKCAGCVSAVERQLMQHEGVVSACVNLVTEVAVIQYQADRVQPKILAQHLSERGFATTVRQDASNVDRQLESIERRKQETKQQLVRLLIATILLFFCCLGHFNQIASLHLPVISNIWFHWGLATIALLLCGFGIIVDGWRGLRHGNPNMNTLVGLGTVSAYLASCVALLFPQLGWECFFDEPVMLLSFIVLGRTLESRARNKAIAALEALIALQPQVARLVSQKSPLSEEAIAIPIEQVRLGEWVKVLPGEKIPVDGEVILGRATVDESMLTGESTPVVKQKTSSVAAGTINQSGAIVIQVTRIGDETTLAKIIALVEQAQTRKAPVQKLADTVAGYFAYGVMTVASLTFLFWYLWGTTIWPEVLLNNTSVHHGIHQLPAHASPLLLSLKLAISTLVIACPCALGLATPTAILVGTGIGAEKGILIKGGDILERVHRLDTVVFDKTGTLTCGRPVVTDCVPIGVGSENYLLQLAAAVERGTNHPLAEAILRAAKERELEPLNSTDFSTEAGEGVSATVEGTTVCLGNPDWLAQRGIILNQEIRDRLQILSQEGKTVVCLARETEAVGLIAVRDILRPDAAIAVEKLQKLGLHIVLLTGDNNKVAESIGKQLGISEIFAEVKPDRKAAIIESLQEGSNLPNKKPKIVAMIGDGINDAPALARSDIGISLHGGTDAAIETADLILMRERLLDVVESIQLGLATFAKIRQNLFWALGYNILAIPIAAGLLLPTFGILLSPSVAAALMASSSAFVVTNSLLLRHQVTTRNN
jgi:Cu2+-exporting ATPase